MINETVILIIQSMQLPVVALIFLFTLNSRIATAINLNQNRFSFIGNLKGIVNKKNPLGFVAIGLLSNLLYLMIKIGTNKQLNFIHINDDTLHSLTVLFDILTTYFFLLESLPDFIASGERNLRNLNRQILRRNILFKRRLTFIIVTLITIAVVWNNWQSFNLWFYIYDFIGYLLVSIYLFKQISIRDIFQRNIYSSYYVSIGFFIWALLQLLIPFGVQFKWNENTVTLIGFSISIFCKGLILFGLNDFSVKIVRSANKELEFRNDRLKQKVESINALQGLINTISNSSNLSELSTHVVNHLTNKSVFNFEYAIFSEIDYLKQKIVYKASKTVNDNIKHIEEWVLKEGISLEHHDIMAVVVKEQKVIHAYQDFLNNEKINLVSESSPLNKVVYDKYNHKKLNRFFIPVLDLSNNIRTTNRVVAIIEAGFHIEEEINFIEDRIYQQGELNLYLDNFSQSYERLYNQKIENETNLILKDCDNKSKDDPTEFLATILESLNTLLNTNLGFIIIFPLNREFMTLDLSLSKNKFNEKNRKTINQIISKCFIKDMNTPDKLLVDKAKFQKEISLSFGMNSFHLEKIIFNENTIGYLCLLSEKVHLFNEVVKTIVNKISSNISILYNEKKFHSAVATLVTPDNTITDLEANMQPLIDMVKSYFDTPYISIWVKDDGESYIQKFSSAEFGESCKRYGSKRILSDTIKLDEAYKIIPLDSSSISEDYEVFKEYAGKNRISTLLQKSIKTQHQDFGFINIYFKNSLNHLTYEEINFINFISIKALTTMQIHNLVSAFRKISDSFTRNDLKATLKTITDSAMTLLNADPVILFQSNNGIDVYFKDATFSNIDNFKHNEILNLFERQSDSHVELAELVIRDKSMFFNNEKEYNVFINNHSKIHEQTHFKASFWEREEIKSLAAIRLVTKIANNNRPVGVMFINFRNEITFNEETKRIIETFAAFAAGSIYNGFVFERNRQYLLSNLRLTKPLLAEALTAGALHDAKKTFSSIHAFYNGLIKKIDNPYDVNNKKMDATGIRRELGRLEVPILDLEEHFTKIESLYKPAQVTVIKSVDLVKLIRNQLEVMDAELHQNHIRVIFEPLENEVFIDCDESQIGLAILNILKNAYQAMGTRGILEVKLKQTENEKVKIEIIDDGKGISDDIKDLIFEPYITDKIGGSGLGLPMSKYAIEINHFGNIKGLTKDNRTTFTIFLPIKHLKPIE